MTYFTRLKLNGSILLAIMYLTGCATVDNSQQDPWEPMNRAIFEFNETVDDKIFEPVAKGYKRVVPDPIEMVVGNFFSNLNDVVVTANALLQLNFNSALASGTRILINTTFGMLGIIDIASDVSMTSDIDISKHNEDFGQTLGHYGVASGPYLVIPFLGPSSVRDAVGIGVDGFFADPVTTGIYLGSIEAAVRVPTATGRALDTRAQLLDTDKTLEEAALDKYEFIRDAYFQRRESLVYNGNVPETEDDDID